MGCFKVMEDSVESQTRIIVVCFGLMIKTQTSVNLKELKEREKCVI
jgi:hypothetical protein